MDKLHATIHKASRSVRLDPETKAGFRRTLEALASTPEVVPTGFSMPRALAWALVAVIVASTGATVTYASTQAIPGDALYDMKVNLVEPTETALAFSEDAKADVAVTHLQRRFAEAAALSAQGKLEAHDEALAQLAARDVATVDRDDQPVARARFEALAATYAPGLKIRDIARSRFAAAVHIDADDDTQVSDDVAKATAQEQLAIAKEKGNAAQKSGNNSAAVAFRLKAAGRLSQDASDELNKGSYQAALKLSSAAAQAALEAQLFASLSTTTTSTVSASSTASSTHSTTTATTTTHTLLKGNTGNGSHGGGNGSTSGSGGGIIHGLLH